MSLVTPTSNNVHTFIGILKHILTLQYAATTTPTPTALYQTLPLLHILNRALQRTLRFRLLQLHLMLLLRIKRHRGTKTRHFKRHLRDGPLVVLTSPTRHDGCASASDHTHAFLLLTPLQLLPVLVKRVGLEVARLPRLLLLLLLVLRLLVLLLLLLQLLQLLLVPVCYLQNLPRGIKLLAIALL